MNVRAVCELRLDDSQRVLVAAAAVTVAEGGYEPNALLRAICADEEPVGVVLVETESLVPFLARFMVDVRYQRQGIGRRAVALIAAELHEAGCRELQTSFVPVDHGAEGFWLRCGFADTGRRTYEGEPIFAFSLNQS